MYQMFFLILVTKQGKLVVRVWLLNNKLNKKVSRYRYIRVTSVHLY